VPYRGRIDKTVYSIHAAPSQARFVTLRERKDDQLSDHERQLLARARELADLGELAEEVTATLGGARRAGLDPDALGGLIGAAAALGTPGITVYAAGKGPGPRYAGEGAFLRALADAEDDIAERLKAAGRLHDQSVTALDSALDALDAARAMHTREPCDGCHGWKAAAIADAEARVRLCEDAIEILVPLEARLRHALARIRAVPGDLGETYESVYTLIRRGGVMPYEGRWIEGARA
jgi:hypothetical protein